MKVRPFRSALVSAFPSSVICGIAFDPITAELYSKLISRSIFGFELAIDAILSRSSVESERVGRLRNAPMNFVSSAARAASAGDVVRPRVTRGFSAIMMSSAERCSAANASPEKRVKPTAKVAPGKSILRLLKTIDSLLSDQEAMLSGSTLPRDIAHRDGCDTPDYNSAGIGRWGRRAARSGSGEDRFAIFNCHAVERNRSPQRSSQRQKLAHLVVADPQLAARLQVQLGSLADHIESIEEGRLPGRKGDDATTHAFHETSAPDAWPIPRDKPMADTSAVAEMNL